ncbi:MAG: hypothetical protein RLY31_336 [Bacteroidota bacterium]
MAEDKRLFLLDGHALVYRAHYAFITRPLVNSKGWNTSAISGFVRMLVDLIDSQHPTHLAVSFDLPTPTFRSELFPAYKANRDQQPEDITFAIPWIMKILDAWKIPILTLEGFEADDVIGTIAKKAEKKGYKVYMVTPDKDYGQLVSENIFLYKPGRQGNEVEVWGEKEVCESWGIRHVDQVVDMLGLQGDAVDNIPGVPGIGPKTAATLLASYGSVENLLQHVADVKGKNKERLETFADQALLSKKLAVIDIDAPIDFDAHHFDLEPFDRDTLADIFRELEFRSLAEKILGRPAAAKPRQTSVQGNLFEPTDLSDTGQAEAIAPMLADHAVAEKTLEDTPHAYHIAATAADCQRLVEQLLAAPCCCFDTETTHIDPNQAELVGLSFAVKPYEAWWVPIPADRTQAEARLDIFRPLLENPGSVKIGQNIKYDAIVLKWYGINLEGPLFDTMLAHYLLEPELRHGMNFLAETYLKYKPIPIETLIGKGTKQLTMREADPAKVAVYAAEDADVTLRLYEFFEPRLRTEGLTDLFETLEIPLVEVLVDMEYNGIRLDTTFLQTYSIELEEALSRVEQDIHRQAGQSFNIASPRQIGEILFEKMKIPYKGARTKSGQYATDEARLLELADQYPLVRDILRHRGLAKLKSTYVDALPTQVNPRTGRVHTSFNQALAATGRLSSNNPNLQNIPIKTPEGAKVREAFIPRNEHYRLLSADYSQVELRLIAAISGDEAMLDAFRQGQDIHRATAARVYGVPYESVTAEQRRHAKTVNFSIIYGAGATNISQQLGIRRTEAKELIDTYFQQYAGLQHYMEETVEFARSHGFVKTLLGRRRYLRDIGSRNALARSNAERMAINTPIQGTAADLIKMAMISIHGVLRDSFPRTKMILQVHDELVFDVPVEDLEAVSALVRDHMTHAMPGLAVPLVVETGTGNNWREAH